MLRLVVAVAMVTLACWGAWESPRPAAAQERIYGAAIPYPSSYPRGEANDRIYEDYVARNGAGAFAPWRAFGLPYYGWSPYWYGYATPWGTPWNWYGRRAPSPWEQSPYYAWPYEWSYGVPPEGTQDPYMQWAVPRYEVLPAPLPGPRRMYW